MVIYPVVSGNVVSIKTCGSSGSLGPGMTMLKVKSICAVCGVEVEESVTCAGKPASVASEGVPDMTLVSGLNVRPDGKPPEGRLQLYGGVPPEQVRAA